MAGNLFSKIESSNKFKQLELFVGGISASKKMFWAEITKLSESFKEAKKISLAQFLCYLSYINRRIG